jgi:hypothetical protein
MLFNILPFAKSLLIRGGTHFRTESIARTANRRSYRRLARKIDPATTLGEISDLATTAGLNPAVLTLASIRRIEAVGS